MSTRPVVAIFNGKDDPSRCCAPAPGGFPRGRAASLKRLQLWNTRRLVLEVVSLTNADQ